MATLFEMPRLMAFTEAPIRTDFLLEAFSLWTLEVEEGSMNTVADRGIMTQERWKYGFDVGWENV